MHFRELPGRFLSKYSFLFAGKTSRTRIQFFRYVFVGGISAVIDTGVFMLLTVSADAHYILAQTFGFIAGITTNYLLSISWIFERSRSVLPETGLFLATGLVGLLLSYLLLYVFIDILGMTAFENMVAKLLTIAIVLAWNFTSRKFLVFHKNTL